MKKGKIYLSILVSFLTILIYKHAMTYSSGAPAGTTGAPDEFTCDQLYCHAGPPASTGGSILFDNGNTSYTPGQTYSIKIEGESGMKNGFQITALFDGDNSSAGSFIITDVVNTKSINLNSRNYVTHSSSGSDDTSWTFDWEASNVNAGKVTFYLAVNKANGNAAVTGDSIFTTTTTITADSTYIDTSSFTPQKKTVLLEQFRGGVRMSNPVLGDSIMQSLIDNNMEVVIGINYTSDNFASGPYDFSNHDFRTTEALDLESMLGPPSGYPVGAINRNLFNSETEILLTKSKWQNYVEQSTDDTTSVNITMQNYWDETTRELSLNIKLHYLKEITDTNNLSIAIVEDNIADPQSTFSGIDTFYVHNHTLRYMLSPYNGVSLNPPNAPLFEKGLVILKDFETTVPDSFKIWNIKVIAFVHKTGNEFDVLQAAIIDSIGGYPTGIKEQVTKKEFLVYPNPAKSQLYIKFNAGKINAEVRFFDLNGSLVKLANATKDIIDISDLPAGIYFIKSNTGQFIVTNKIIIIR